MITMIPSSWLKKSKSRTRLSEKRSSRENSCHSNATTRHISIRLPDQSSLYSFLLFCVALFAVVVVVVVLFVLSSFFSWLFCCVFANRWNTTELFLRTLQVFWLELTSRHQKRGDVSYFISIHWLSLSSCFSHLKSIDSNLTVGHLSLEPPLFLSKFLSTPSG